MFGANLDRASAFFGKKVIRLSVPGSRDGRQPMEIEFEDGEIATGSGKDVVAAFGNLCDRRRIKSGFWLPATLPQTKAAPDA